MEADLASPQCENKAHETHVTDSLKLLYFYFKKLDKKVLECPRLLGLEIPGILTVEKVWHAQISQWNAKWRWHFLTPLLSRNQLQSVNTKKKGENSLDYVLF